MKTIIGIDDVVRHRFTATILAAVFAIAPVVLFVAAPPASAKAARGLVGTMQVGNASWYGPRFHGRRTANGEVFDQHAMTAAHRRLPLGTVVAVTSLDTGRTVKVRINDRGPYVGGRIIDLSRAAAKRLGLIRQGVGRVKVKVVKMPPRTA